jgi:hypothetical protein
VTPDYKDLMVRKRIKVTREIKAIPELKDQAHYKFDYISVFNYYLDPCDLQYI